MHSMLITAVTSCDLTVCAAILITSPQVWEFMTSQEVITIAQSEMLKHRLAQHT